MVGPRHARIAGCAVVLLAGAAAMNVAYLQDGVRERRKPSIPVGLNVPPPRTAPVEEARRPSGPMTLTLASLLEAEAERTFTTPRATQATEAPPNRIAGIAAASDGLTVPPQSSDATSRAPGLVREVQAALAARGFEPGPIDGDAGLLTRAAILAFEHDAGLPMTAEPSDALIAALRAPRTPTRSSGGRQQIATPTAAGIVKAVQEQLIASGHLAGVATGRLDGRTSASIRAFEAAHGLLVTGRISAQLVARLQQTAPRRATVASGR